MKQQPAYVVRCPDCGKRIETPDVWANRAWDPDLALANHRCVK